MSLPDAEELNEDLELFDDWVERYQYIIDLGKKLRPLPDDQRTEAHKVTGCMSQVWLSHERRDDGTLHFFGDSDAAIVRGLIAVLFSLYSGKRAQEIERVDLDGFFARHGLEEHLSPNRRNGFFAMVERIKSAR